MIRKRETMKKYDVIIIGGGAAGLAAAASLNNGIKTCILEKNGIPGRKIMATGGGRCNITNEACENKDTALEFFKCLGLETYCDREGRYYPYSNHASDVVKILTDNISKKDTEILTDFEAVSAECSGSVFTVSDAKGRAVSGRTLIVAAGGKAAPQLGTVGDGYVFAKSFGHSIKKVYPILTGIKTGDMKAVKGVRAAGKASLYKDGTLVAEESGEIQFNEDGISGICVMNLTVHITSDEGKTLDEALPRYRLQLDLAPDFTEEELSGRKSSFGILTEKLAGAVDISRIKCMPLPVKGVKGWRDAQCTAGGVNTEEINTDTMESLKVEGLYFAGEVLDIQGPCGGYNLQNAWETGIKAANAINRRFLQVSGGDNSK